MSLYKHPDLAKRVENVKVVDRFVRGIAATWEQIITLGIATKPSGEVCVTLSVDTVNEAMETSGCSPLAVYPSNQQPDALQDAILLSMRWGLSLRRAEMDRGWTWVRLGDWPLPLDQDEIAPCE